jgi:methyl-accepting chemotaxis protein
MKIKYKLGILGISTTIAVVVVSTFILVNSASRQTMDMNHAYMIAVTDEQLAHWGGTMDGYVRVLRTLANVMSGYENLEPEIRRDNYDEILRSVIEAEPYFLELNTVWRPNAIDGMDAQMIGRPGSTDTGQYAVNFSRELGANVINKRATGSVPQIMAHITGPNARLDRVEHPAPRTIWSGDTYLMRISVPIINPRTNEVVGMVSCQLDLAMVQPVLMQTLEDNPDIAAMSIYANNSFVIASYVPENIGQYFHEVSVVFGDRLEEARQAVQNGVDLTFYSFSPSFNSNMMIDIGAITIGNSDMTWSIMLAKSEANIMAPIWAMTRLAVIVAAIIIGRISSFVKGSRKDARPPV